MEDLNRRGDSISVFFDKLHEGDQFNGSVHYSIDGSVKISAGYGPSDRRSGQVNGPGTVFQIASVSKQFTAASILLLEEDGKLSVHDRIAEWLPDSPPSWKDIAIHHLLTHTSGLPHWGDIPTLDLFNPVGEESILSAFSSCPLRFPPGRGWYYSSPGFHLLSLITRRASGEKYQDFLKSRIFEPLGMTSTSAVVPGTDSPIARGYDSTGEEMKSFDLGSTGMGAGDAWSTVEDLARWDDALSKPGRLLEEHSLEVAFQRHAPLSGEILSRYSPITGVAYGYGWFLGQLDGAGLRFHTGDNPGYRAINVWKPDSREILCILSNQHDVEVGSIAISFLKSD